MAWFGSRKLNPNQAISVSNLLFSTFSRLAFWAWGFAPLLIVHHSFNIKFNKPSIIKRI